MFSNDKSLSAKQRTQSMRRMISSQVAGQRVEKKLESIEKLVDEYLADGTPSFGPYAGNQLIFELKASILKNALGSSDAVALAAASKIEFSSEFVDSFFQIAPTILGVVDVNLTPRLLVSPSFGRALPFFQRHSDEKRQGRR